MDIEVVFCLRFGTRDFGLRPRVHSRCSQHGCPEYYAKLPAQCPTYNSNCATCLLYTSDAADDM
eukprot:1312919-Alexandrium_andersonii.AAC.1